MTDQELTDLMVRNAVFPKSTNEEWESYKITWGNTHVVMCEVMQLALDGLRKNFNIVPKDFSDGSS